MLLSCDNCISILLRHFCSQCDWKYHIIHHHIKRAKLDQNSQFISTNNGCSWMTLNAPSTINTVFNIYVTCFPITRYPLNTTLNEDPHTDQRTWSREPEKDCRGQNYVQTANLVIPWNPSFAKIGYVTYTNTLACVTLCCIIQPFKP